MFAGPDLIELHLLRGQAAVRHQHLAAARRAFEKARQLANSTSNLMKDRIEVQLAKVS
jgi:hypothetical protein